MSDMERIEREAFSAEWRYRRMLELRGIIALWGPAIRNRPRDSRKGWTVYDGYVRNRDEEWTIWRAVVCTVAILLGRRWTDAAADRWARRHGRPSPWADCSNLAYFDCGSTYGGYTVEVVQLAPGCRFSVFNDGESNL